MIHVRCSPLFREIVLTSFRKSCEAEYLRCRVGAVPIMDREEYSTFLEELDKYLGISEASIKPTERLLDLLDKAQSNEQTFGPSP